MIQILECFAAVSRRPRRPVILLAAAVGAILLSAPSGFAASAADTAATHTYLQARYELYLALERNVPAVRAAIAAASSQLARECPGVLAGAPRDEGPFSLLQPRSNPTPRERGERARSERQQATIFEELFAALGAGRLPLDGQAAERFAATTAPLSWSDARIAPLVHATATSLQEALAIAPADACADMKAWAQSGFRTLSPASRSFQSTLTARAEHVAPEGSLSALLKPYEGGAERALLRHTDALGKKLVRAELGELKSTIPLLQRALGVPASPAEEPQSAPVLGRGVTRSGARFVVRPETGEGPHDASCRHPLTVEMHRKSPKGNSVAFGSSAPVCVSRSGDRSAFSECGDDEISITAAVPASVRAVRLQLSDGSAVTSRVVRIPRRDGGPAGVYVQALRGEKRYPVSLTELDRRHNVVRVLRVPHARCRREPSPVPPKYVDLARGTLPGGQPFVIEGLLDGASRHRPHFSLTVRAHVPDFGLITESEGEESEIAVGPPGTQKAFRWSQQAGCPPHAFALVYGILAPPGDSVLARTPEGLVPLTKQGLVPKLHAGGSLAYGVFASLPSELIVRRSDGSTLYGEDLTVKATERREFCEGSAEG
jgi:hypothetical protein